MTPEERAAHLLRPGGDVGCRVWMHCAPPLIEDLSQAIAQAIREAVLDERKACVRICAGYPISRGYALAQAITRERRESNGDG